MSRGEFLRVVCASCAVTCVNRAWLVRRKESAKQASVRDEVKALHVETEHRACSGGNVARQTRRRQAGPRPQEGRGRNAGWRRGLPDVVGFQGVVVRALGTRLGLVCAMRRASTGTACARLRVASGASRDAARGSDAELTRHCHCSATAADGPQTARRTQGVRGHKSIATNLGSERWEADRPSGVRRAAPRRQRCEERTKRGNSKYADRRSTVEAGKEQPHVTANVRTNDTLALPN
ncbi:hypothetical protein ERJ75_000654800 [Trypanosoma vivax]|nr:hypothetical protein ERJ75_000654800 [Trypanosoma vivax]